jgi:triosephosphate isomerase
MRNLLISANWKMNNNHFESIEAVTKLSALLRAAPVPAGREASLHPPFTSLRSVQTMVESEAVPLALGAQTCHWEDRGAYTGEVSAEFLAKLGVRYVICGHSERRAGCGETDVIVRAKVDAVLRQRMTPILCVGETSSEREGGEAQARVRSQLEAALSERPGDVVGSMVIAYEPIWAIGTGVNATPADAQEMCHSIRSVVLELAGGAAAESLRVQYGGSATPTNAAELLAEEDVDGLLVGGASLDPEKFVSMVHA